MRHAPRFALSALGAPLPLVLSGCQCDAGDDSAAPGETQSGEPEAPRPHPCLTAAGLREALELGPVRIVRTEQELSGEAPTEVLVWYTADDPRTGTADAPAGAKVGRLHVLDCSGEGVRSLGERTFSYVDDPQTVHMVAGGAGVEMRPVAAGGRTFLRVDLTSLAESVFTERAVFLEVHEGALRDVFACETARDTRTDEGVSTVRRDVRVVDDEGLRVQVRQQRDEGEVEEAAYVWSEDAFEPSGEALCGTPGNEGEPETGS